MPTYPTPPGNRFDLASDGTDVLVKADAEADAAFQVVPQATVAAICGVAFATQVTKGLAASNGVMRVRAIFPEPRQILGLRWSGWSDYGSSYNIGARYSLDATAAGWNGTWTNLANHGGQGRGGDSIDVFRTAWVAQALDNVLGLEFWVQNTRGTAYTGRIGDLHIYGARAATGDHLMFWHPTLDQPLPGGSFDFGDLTRGVPPPGRPFRIKNVSATKTAVGIVLSYGDLDAAPLGGDSGQVSADNDTWFPNLNIGDLAPGAVSPIRYLRVSPVANRNLRAAAAGRIRANPTSWTG